MNHQAEQFYQNMLVDMHYCRQKQLDRGTELECLFSICNRYWAIVQHEIAHYEFATGNEEIHFFKVIKPKFISEKIYIGLLNHAHLFLSGVQAPGRLQQFWEQETQRLEKFIASHDDFYKYYLSGRTDKDAHWFTRYQHSATAGNEELTATGKDHLVSMLLALERYHEYIRVEQTHHPSIT